MSALFAFFLLALRPVGAGDVREFVVVRGAGAWEIAQALEDEELIRSPIAFSVLAILSGGLDTLKPGRYEIAPTFGARRILHQLIAGAHREVEVVIPEGMNAYDIDALLARVGVLSPGALITYVRTPDRSLEGRLFPDTYRFFTDSSPEDVVRVMQRNFDARVLPLVQGVSVDMNELLTLASLIQNEVPDYEEARIVAGILKRRLAIDMPLQIDATICYVKDIAAEKAIPCHPLTDLDFRISSPYNTYLYKGLPPGPISNPGVRAIQAVLAARTSPYLFYLSDPETRKTVFSRTFDEHRENRARYLE